MIVPYLRDAANERIKSSVLEKDEIRSALMLHDAALMRHAATIIEHLRNPSSWIDAYLEWYDEH